MLAQPAPTVPVYLWRPPWSRVRASGDLGHSIRVSEVGQSQVNDGRSFLCVCGVFFVVGFCDVTVDPTHRKKRPRVPRAVPSFSEHRNCVLLRCAMQNEAPPIGDTEATPLLVYEPFMLGLYDGRYENARVVLMPVAGWLSVTRAAIAASRWRGWRMATSLIINPA